MQTHVDEIPLNCSSVGEFILQLCAKTQNLIEVYMRNRAGLVFLRITSVDRCVVVSRSVQHSAHYLDSRSVGMLPWRHRARTSASVRKWLYLAGVGKHLLTYRFSFPSRLMIWKHKLTYQVIIVCVALVHWVYAIIRQSRSAYPEFFTVVHGQFSDSSALHLFSGHIRRED